MSNITEQVREGLTNKIKGIENALLFVKDPREVERLHGELKNANKALAKLNEKDTRSPEEVKKIEKLLAENGEVAEVEAPWGDKTPIEKFQYQVELYFDRLKETKNKASEQQKVLEKVIHHLIVTKGGNGKIIQPVIDQFNGSLAEVSFSLKNIEEQLKLSDKTLQLAHDEEFFDKLSLLNQFLNNPMSLPHLSEEYEKKLGALRNANKK